MEAGCRRIAVDSGSYARASEGGEGENKRRGVKAAIACSAGSSAGAGQHCSVGGKARTPEARGTGLRGAGGRRRRAITAGACSTPWIENADQGLRHAASAPVAGGTPHARGVTAGGRAVLTRLRLAGSRTRGAGVVASCCSPGPRRTGGWGCIEGAPMPCWASPARQGAKASAGRGR